MKLVGVSFKPDLCAAIVEGRKDVTRRSTFKGAVGDVLYVREALACDCGSVVYNRDGAHVEPVRDWTWRPQRLAAMYMPKWAARTFRRIVDVRTERIRDITEDDARREGVARPSAPCGDCTCLDQGGGYRCAFALLWDAINGARPGLRWQDNPEIVRVEFAALTAEELEEVKMEVSQ